MRKEEEEDGDVRSFTRLQESRRRAGEGTETDLCIQRGRKEECRDLDVVETVTGGTGICEVLSFVSWPLNVFCFFPPA